MSLSHAYRTPPDPSVGGEVLRRALDLGYTHLDTAALYGFGANETLIGQTLRDRRHAFTLGSKGGMFRNEQGQRAIDGRPEVIRDNCDESLARLGVETIDLYYLHRWDRRIPIEESVGALADLVRAGKVRAIGLSEVSAATLRRAHAEHPIAAVQSEYSLWTRNPEVAVLDACRALGVTFVAFSPLGRGFLTGTLREVASLPATDIRLKMPRFQEEHFTRNLGLLDALVAVARDEGCTPAQAALAWVLSRGDRIVPIPSTTRLDHLEENAAAADLRLSEGALTRLEAAISPRTVSGGRYNAATQAEIDTEELPVNA
jgi:aryl-alcohol dehydrogenase-like predicted oxidoreductase